MSRPGLSFTAHPAASLSCCYRLLVSQPGLSFTAHPAASLSCCYRLLVSRPGLVFHTTLRTLRLKRPPPPKTTLLTSVCVLVMCVSAVRARVPCAPTQKKQKTKKNKKSPRPYFAVLHEGVWFQPCLLNHRLFWGQPELGCWYVTELLSNLDPWPLK